MALRTAATTKFGDARAAVPQPVVNLPLQRAPVDQTAATAVGAFGVLGGEFRKGLLENELETNFQETGNIIQTLNDDRTVITRRFDGSVDIDISQSDPHGDIDKASAAFQSITLGLDQGKISQERAAIEAEVILRKSIARAPAFADTFRKRAQEILGFNASGATMEALFLSGPSASNSLTQADRDNIEANQLVKTGHFDTFEQALKAIVGKRAFEYNEAINKQQILFGDTSAAKVINKSGISAQRRLNPIMNDAFAQIAQTGFISNIDDFKQRFDILKDNIKDEYTQIMLQSKLSYKPEHYDAMRAEVDRAVDANFGILQNKEISAVLTKRRDVLQRLMELDSFRLGEDLLFIGQFGPAMLDAYIEFMAQANGDPQTRERLMKENSLYNTIGELLDSRKIAPTFVAIREEQLRTQIDNPNSIVDEETAKEVVKYNAIKHLSGSGDPITIDADIKALSDLDLPNMMLSLVGNTDYSYASTTPRGKATVTAEWKAANKAVRQPLGRIITNSNSLLGFNAETGKFELQLRQPGLQIKTSEAELATQFAGGAPLTPRELERFQRAKEPGPDAQAELEILNDVILPAMKDVNWRNDFGEPDPEAWADRLIVEVNSFALNEERIAGRLGETGVPGSLRNLTLDQQTRIQTALQSGNEGQVFDTLEEMGLGKFNQTTEGLIGLPLERLENGAAFLNTETNEVFMFENGKLRLAPKDLLPQVTLPIEVNEQVRAQIPKGRELIANKIAKASIDRGIDPNLMLAISIVESELDPNAKNPDSTASGLFQNIEGNFKDFGPVGGDPFNTEDSIVTGMNFMKLLQTLFDTEDEQILRWHDGQNSSGEASPKGKNFVKKVRAILDKLETGVVSAGEE